MGAGDTRRRDEAAIDGRDDNDPDEVLRHRLLLTYDALAREITPDLLVNRILSSVPATWVSPKPNAALDAAPSDSR